MAVIWKSRITAIVKNQRLGIAAAAAIIAAAAVGHARNATRGIERRPGDHVALNNVEAMIQLGITASDCGLNLVVLGVHVELGVFTLKLPDILILLAVQDAPGVDIVIVDYFAESGIELTLKNGGVFVHRGFNVGQTGIIILGGMFIVSPMAEAAPAVAPWHTKAIARAKSITIAAEYPEQDQEENDNAPHRGGVRASCVAAAFTIKHKETPYTFEPSGIARLQFQELVRAALCAP